MQKNSFIANLSILGMLLALQVMVMPYSCAQSSFFQDLKFSKNIAPITQKDNAHKAILMNAAQAAHYLLQLKNIPSHSPISFQLSFQNQSNYSRQYQFDQYYKGILVYNSSIKIITDQQGNILSIYDNSIPSADLLAITVDQHTELYKRSIADAEHAFTQNSEYACANYKLTDRTSLVWYQYGKHSNEIILAYCNKIMRDPAHYLILFNGYGETLYYKDLNDYYTQAAATVKVFDPDPLSTALQTYGGNYTDNNDAVSSYLTAQLLSRTTQCSYDANTGQYLLENDLIKLVSLPSDLPNYPVTFSMTPFFNYNRNEPGFEDVMVFYHLQKFTSYIRTLEENICDGVQLHIDAHALSYNVNGNLVDDDQSLYNGDISPPTIRFGLGGVDDAEDADVIIHEFSHNLSKCANGGTNTGMERKAIDEAFCDYFALSYSLDVNDYNWGYVFSWDGHNEFWDGRNADNNYIYTEIYDMPEFQPNVSIYELSLLWSGAMMDIYWAIGANPTDRIATETLYHLQSNMSFKEAATALVNAATLLYGNEYYTAITTQLAQRGLWDLTIEAGPDQTICMGDSITLGTTFPTIEGLSINWTSAIGAFNSDLPNPIIRPGYDNTYYLTVTNYITQEITKDTLQVHITHCGSEYGDTLQVLNTDMFYNANAPLYIKNKPGLIPNSVQLLNIHGQVLYDTFATEDGMIVIEPAQLHYGIYFIRIIYPDTKARIFKIAKGVNH